MPIPSGGFEFDRRNVTSSKTHGAGRLISLQALGFIWFTFDLDAVRHCDAGVEPLRGPIGRIHWEYEQGWRL